MPVLSIIRQEVDIVSTGKQTETVWGKALRLMAFQVSGTLQGNNGQLVVGQGLGPS